MDDVIFAPLLRFAVLAARPEQAMDLAEGALLIADVAYPALDHPRYHQRLDALAAAVRAECATPAGGAHGSEGEGERAVALRTLAAMRTVLVEREGFRGNNDEYFAARNSYLNAVLNQRTGLPITLSIIYLEVARRLGVPLRGVGLPAHFVVKWPLAEAQGGDIFVDAFHGGELLDLAGCQRLVARAAGASGAHLLFDPQWTAPLGTRAILTRLLRNLKMLYLQRGETALALEIVERLILLCPNSPEEVRDRGLLRLAMGEPLLAAVDIATYATRAPHAPDVRRLRHRLAGAAELRAKLN
ncbi:MAG: transglutaminase family protein [Ktedonobacterales bacterium]|nr:transglutaminase family protein [Ktedonobacterales bacterium]